MPTVYNKRRPPYPYSAVYIGRGSKWGNPYVIGLDGSRADVIVQYAEHVTSHPSLREDIVRELRGKDLVCYCSPLDCHGDILLAMANEEDC